MSIWGNIVNFGKKIVDDIEGNNNGGNPSPVVQSPQNLPILGFKPTPTSIPGNPMGAPGFNLTPNLNPNSSTNIGSNLGTLNVPGIKLGNPSFTPNQPTPQVQPVHNNFFNPLLHYLNQAGNGAVSDLKDFGDLGSLGMANLTGNHQAANNARNAIGNNNANLGTKNFATNLGGLSQDVGLTDAAKAYVNTAAGLATNAVNGLTHQNLTSQQAIGGGPLGGLTNWASNNGTINEGTGRNLAGNAINTAVNLLTLGKGKAIEQAGERGIQALLPKLAESGLGRAAQRLGGSEVVAGLYGAGQGTSQAAQSANNIKEGLTDVGKGVVHNLPFGAIGVLPNATHGLINTANKVADSTPAIINQTRKSMTNQIGRIGINNVADNHPAVTELNNHLDNLNKLRDGMTQSGLDERNPAMVNNAKAYQATLDELNKTRNAITQGGYAKIPGTPEPTPGAPQVGKTYQVPISNKTDVTKLSDRDLQYFAKQGYTEIKDTFGNIRTIKKLAPETLDSRIAPHKLTSDTVYHGTSADNTQAIIKGGFKAGSELPENAFRGGGHGELNQNSISFSTSPKQASVFGATAGRGSVLEAKLKPNSNVVTVKGIDYAEDLNKLIPSLKKKGVDAVYLPGEKEVVVINKGAVKATGKTQDFKAIDAKNTTFFGEAPQVGKTEAPQPIKIAKPKTGDDLSNPQNYADTFGITKQQAEQDFKKINQGNQPKPERNLQAEQKALSVLQNGGLKNDAIKAYQDQAGVSNKKASIAVTKAAQEANQALRPNKSIPNPITKKLPEVTEGDYLQARKNPQIVSNDILNNGKEAIKTFNKLTDDEKKNFWYQVEDPSIPRSTEMQKAINWWTRTTDTVHAWDTSLSGQTRHIENYAVHGELDLSNPKDAAKYEQMMLQKGVTDTEPSPYNGYHNKPRVFGSRVEAENAGFKYVPKTPLDEMINYIEGSANALKKQALIESAAKADVGTQATKNLDIGVVKGTPTSLRLSEEGAKQLKGYANPNDVNKPLSIYRQINRGAKANILGVSGYHHVNVDVFQAFPSLFSNHPILATKGLYESTRGLFDDNFAHQLMQKNIKSGLTEKAARIGSPLRQGSDFSNSGTIKLAGKGNVFEKHTFDNAIALMHSRIVEGAVNDLEKRGISLDSKRAANYGVTINHTMGLINQEVQNLRPSVQHALGDIFFAPQFTRSKWALFKDLTRGNEASAQAARTIIGKYVMGVTLAVSIGALVGQKTDNTKDTLVRQLVRPGIETNISNGRGGKVELGSPANIISEAAGLIAQLKRGQDGHLSISLASPSKVVQNVENYGRNRLAVLPGSGLKIATNTQFNGQNVYDPNANPLQRGIQIVTNTANSLLPIPLQAVGASSPVNKAISLVSPTAANALKMGNTGINPLVASAATSFALTPRTDQTQGISQKNTQFQDTRSQLTTLLSQGKLSQIDPSLHDVSPSEGQYLLQSYNSLHPKSVKDFATQDIQPKDWNALSAEQKASYYLVNDQKTGAQHLSPLFLIDQKLAQLDPSRPHSPIYNLNGTGVGFTLDSQGNIVGTQDIPKAQVALNYQNMPSGDPQRYLVEQANPWLKDYSNAVGNFASNYKANMSQFLINNGYNQDGVNQYLQKHPSSTSPIAYPQSSQSTTDIMNNYDSITDPTAKAEYFVNNKDALTSAFNAIAKYQNQSRAAKGDLPLQSYPEATPEVAGLLAQLQKNPNHDKSISAANSTLIKNNPVLNQYLADIGVYGTTKDLSKYLYQNPSYPGMTQGQLLNNGDNLAQSTLKGISNLASYDIGKNANGQYSFMQNGSLGNGFTLAGSGGSSNKYHKIKKTRTVRIRQHRIKMKVHNQHLRYSMPKQRALRIAKSAKIKPVRIKM